MCLYLILIILSIIGNTTSETDQIEYASWSNDYLIKCVTNVLESAKRIDSNLSCFWISSPPTIIFPGKVEVVNWKPMVVIFRDFLTAEEIESIIKTAEPRITRALVHEDETLTQVPSKTRVTNGTWLTHEKTTTIKKITWKVRQMTGFDTKTAEMWNALFYEKDGHYAVHHDMLSRADPKDYREQLRKFFMDDLKLCWKNEKAFRCIFKLCKGYLTDWWMNRLKEKTLEKMNKFNSGMSRNRLATFIVYLKMPTTGGGTIFPELKLTLEPKAGDAVFWFNIKPDGTKETQTLHGACPVMEGQKRVATLWLNEEGQELLVKCPKSPTNYDTSSFQEGLLKKAVL